MFVVSGEGIAAVPTVGRRRRWLALGAVLFLLPAFGCADERAVVSGETGSRPRGTDSSPPVPEREAPYRLAARPRTNVREEPVYGQSRLGLSSGRDGLLFVPRSYSPGRPVPLALML